MQVLRIATGKLTSWWTGKKFKKVYYPYQDDYDRYVLIGMLQDFECLYSYKASIIVMTHKQESQLEAYETNYMRARIGHGTVQENVFGCKIEIDDFPRGCVVIDEES